MALTAQDGNLAELKGEIRRDRAMSYDRFLVSLYDYSTHQELARVPVATDGSFAFRSVPLRHLTMRVTTETGDVVQESSVYVNQHMLPVEIRLPFQPEPRPPAGGVSVQQLRQHPPAKKAFAAFVQAQHFSESRQYDKAALELEKALEISPDYADAHSNLGAQYTRLKRYQEALSEFDRATAIAGPNTRNLANRAFALEALGRHPEAVESARAAIRLDPGYVQAQYILGNLLAHDPRTIRESIGHLERAADAMPVARETLERVRALLR